MPHLDTMPSPTHHFIEASASQSRADLANALVRCEKKQLESPPTIHGNGKITTFPWKSHSNTGCWWMFHCYVTLLQLVWYQQGARITVFSDSIQYDPIPSISWLSIAFCTCFTHLSSVKECLPLIPGSRTYQRDQPWQKCHMKMICGDAYRWKTPVGHELEI